MSDIFGEGFVRIRPVSDTFAAEAKAQLDQSMAQVKAAAQEKIDVSIGAAIVDETKLKQTRADLKDVESRLKNIADAQRMVSPEVFGRSAYAADLPALERRRIELQRQVFIEQELARASRQRVTEAVRAANAPIVPPVVEERRPGGIGEFIRAGAAGRSSGLGGLLGAGARLGAIGLAATAAFQALGELQQSLRVTGDEAFNAQGKLRNMGAELLGGNVIGAIKALAAERPAQIVGELASKLDALKAKTDPLVITQEKLVAMFERSPEEMNRYLEAMVGLDKISTQTALSMAKLTKETVAQAEAVRVAERAWGDVAAKIREAGSEAAAFGERGQGPGGRGPGAVPPAPGTVIGRQTTGIPRDIIQPETGGTFRPGTGGEAVAAQIRASITRRTQDEAERLRLEVRDKEIIQKQAKAAFDNAKAVAVASGHTDGAAKQWADYVFATTDVVTATQAAEAATEAAAVAAQNLGNAVRDAWVNAIADPAQQAQASLASARVKEGQAKKAFDDAKKGTKAADEAYAAWRIAQAETAGIANSIAYSEQQKAKAAAEAAAASNKAGREQAMENAITTAALTKRTADDKVAFDAAIRYWVSLRNSAENVEDREAARAKVIALYQERAAALKAEAGEDSRLLKITNDILAARLTPGLTDDKKRAHILTTYWAQKMKTATDDAEREKFRTQFLQAKLAEQALKPQGESADVLKEKLFGFAADQFRRFGSNISSTPGGLLAPQDARGLLGGLITQSPEATARRQREAQLSESKKQTAYLQIIAGGQKQKVVGVPPPKEAGELVAKIGSEVLRGL